MTDSKTMGLPTKGLRGNSKNINDRRLETYSLTEEESEYFTNCKSVMGSDVVLGDGVISQDEFAAAYSAFCSEYSSSNECPGDDFEFLPSPVQDVFFDTYCAPMLDKSVCTSNLLSMINMNMKLGYIVSTEAMPAVQEQISKLCYDTKDFVFDPTTKVASFSSSGPIPYDFTGTVGLPDTIENFDAPTLYDPTQPETQQDGFQPRPGPLDLTIDGASSNDLWFNFNSQSDGQFSNAPIIGVAAAATACFVLLVLIAMRKRQNFIEGSIQDSTEYGDVSKPVQKGMESTSDVPELTSVSYNSADTSSVSQVSDEPVPTVNLVIAGDIENAIDQADWDTVYNLASQIAEGEDLNMLSSIGKKIVATESKSRPHLSQDDQGRAATLDELIRSGDWTCVAVTAALYAGESGIKTIKRSLSNEPSAETTEPSDQLVAVDTFESLKKSMDQAVNEGDWDQVVKLTSQVENTSVPIPVPQLTNSAENESLAESELSTDLVPFHSKEDIKYQMLLAIERDEWALVAAHADRLKAAQGAGNSLAIVPATMPETSLVEYRNRDAPADDASSRSKRSTIQRLVEEEKWNGVKIMAGLYQTESKLSL